MDVTSTRHVHNQCLTLVLQPHSSHTFHHVGSAACVHHPRNHMFHIQRAFHNVRFTMYVTQCTFHYVRCIIYIPLCAFHNVRSTMYDTQCTFHYVRYTIYVPLCTFHNLRSIVYVPQCTTKLQIASLGGAGQIWSFILPKFKLKK